MFQRFNHRLGHYLVLLTTGACLYLLNLGGPALWDIDEGRNLTAALEMRESGNWIVPTFNGQLRSHKPALLYWLQVAAFELFGVNEFAGRLPSALAALLALVLVYELGRRMFNASTGLIAGLVLASSVLFCATAHFANPDALLLTFTTATLLSFWLGFSSGRRVWFLVAGLAAGLAVLAKGPVGVVLPIGVIGLFVLWARHWHLAFDRIWLFSLLLCCVVALPWYILVAVETKREFLTEFLLTHNLDRALNAMEDHTGPPWYYLVVLMLGLAPWSAFLGSAIWYGFKGVRSPKSEVRSSICDRSERGTNNELPPSDFGLQTLDDTSASRFLWCWIAIYLLAFTVAATKLPNYILPVFPPLALLIARFLNRWRCGELKPPAWVQLTSTAIVALIGVTTIVGLLIAGGKISIPPVDARSWPGLENWAIVGVIPLVGGTLGAWLLYQERRTAFVAVMLITAMAFLAPLAAGGCVALNEFRAPRPLVEQAGALRRDQDIRIACYRLEFLPSLNFYVQRNVKHYHNELDMADFMRQEHTVFVFLSRRDWDEISVKMPAPHRVMANHREMYRAGEVVVVTNR